MYYVYIIYIYIHTYNCVSLVLLLHIMLSFIMPDFIVLYFISLVCFCFPFEGREKIMFPFCFEFVRKKCTGSKHKHVLPFEN